MNQTDKSAGKTAQRVLRRVVKISGSAISAAIDASREADSAESANSTSRASGMQPTGVPVKTLQVIPLKPSLDDKESGVADDQDLPTQKTAKQDSAAKGTEGDQQNPKKVKVMVSEEGGNFDCDVAFEIEPEDAEQLKTLCCKGETIYDDEPEHPLFPERHKWQYRVSKFKQKHAKSILNGKKVVNFGRGLIRMSLVALILAVVTAGVLLFVFADFEYEIDDGYYASDLTENLGTTVGANLTSDDVLLNEGVYSELSSYVQVTPVDIFNNEQSNKSMSGKNFAYVQPCSVGIEEGFIVDVWACLPKGRTNDSLCIAYPEQLTQEENRPFQVFLVNDRQYKNALLAYLSNLIANDDDEENMEWLERMMNSQPKEIVDSILGKTIGVKHFDQNETRHETWRVALDARTIASQINLTTNKGCVDLSCDSYTEMMEEFNNIESCLELQLQGEIPQELSIPSTTAKILHYRAKFNATNTDYYVTYEGVGFLGNTKRSIIVLLFVIWWILLGTITMGTDVKWVKPIKSDQKNSDNSAENRDVAN